MIRIENLRKEYDAKTVALDDIDLVFEDSTFVALLGPSGCGKTTTLNCIAGLLEPTSGKIFFGDKDVTQLQPKDRNIGMVFQSYALYPHLKVIDNIAFPLKQKGMKKAERYEKARKIAKMLQIEYLLDRKPTQLSGGQQQRIAIARSLLLKPSVLLLDEPFSALDAKIRQQMREELKKIQAELGITVVFVTHDQEEAMALSHRIVVMNKGKFEQVGTPTEVYDNPATKYVASFIGEMNFIEKDGKTIAVRPEDVAITSEPADIQGCVRTIMVLGHYVEVNVQCGDLVVKCFVDRDQSERLTPGDPVNLKFLKTHIF